MRTASKPVVTILPIVLSILLLLPRLTPDPPHLSGWSLDHPFEIARRQASVGAAVVAPVAPAQPADSPPAEEQPPQAMPIPEQQPPLTSAPGASALEQYNQSSVPVDATPDQHVRYYTRTLDSGGSIAYFVVWLSDRVHIEVINADGAIPGSDETGDTIWMDRQQHLATVAEMVSAPYATRENMTLVAAMAMGFHGAVRTSNEGTVVINGTVHRVNPGRAALCIDADGSASIGLFNTEALQPCAQAIGAGPVILWRGKIANPDVAAETEEFLPFNPLGEDFVQLDWRKKIYMGTYPKTVVGVGTRPEGGSYLVLLVSYGVNGIDLARQLKAMGCSDALGGDDDTSTQAVWRGKPVVERPVRAVPDALGVYWREGL